MPRMFTNRIVKKVDFPKKCIRDRVCLTLYQISNTPVFATGQRTEKRPNRIASAPLLLLRGLRYLRAIFYIAWLTVTCYLLLQFLETFSWGNTAVLLDFAQGKGGRGPAHIFSSKLSFKSFDLGKKLYKFPNWGKGGGIIWTKFKRKAVFPPENDLFHSRK